MYKYVGYQPYAAFPIVDNVLNHKQPDTLYEAKDSTYELFDDKLAIPKIEGISGTITHASTSLPASHERDCVFYISGSISVHVFFAAPPNVLKYSSQFRKDFEISEGFNEFSHARANSESL